MGTWRMVVIAMIDGTKQRGHEGLQVLDVAMTAGPAFDRDRK